ncbi:TPA: plasmid stabilization protein StbA [Escherichia coli]|nr:plasmid stabilization protein StbA [Klebsiella pneumoniae]
MKPKSIRAAIQMMLPEVEEMLSLGVSREEVFKAVSERFGLENVNVRSFDTALYRARQNRAKHATPESVLHNTQGKSSAKGTEESVLHNTQPSEPEAQESEKVESPGIIDKEFFNKIGEDFDPKKFNKKF